MVVWLLLMAVCLLTANAAPAVTHGKRAAPGGFLLAGSGVDTCIIYSPSHVTNRPPGAPLSGAHLDLAAYLRLITGREPRVVPCTKVGSSAGSKSVNRIWVGRQPEVDRRLGAELDRLDDDGFIVRVAGHDLYIAGKHSWGDFWAVHQLLERFAGCRWYLGYPEGPAALGPALRDSPGVVIPAQPSVAVPLDLNWVAQPAYRSRFLRQMPQHAFGLRRRDQFHHHLRNIFPGDRYGQEHPEYYPLINGKRVVPEGTRDQTQICVSNPDVVRTAAEAARAYFAANPGAGSFSLGINDNAGFCECPPCLAIAPGSITNRQERQGYAMLDFYNRVAAEVEKTNPGKQLGCLGYSVLQSVPAGSTKLHPSILPYLTLDSAQLFDPVVLAKVRERLNRWASLANQLGIYEYAYGTGFMVPRLYNRFLLENVQERYGVKAVGFYAEDYPNWGLDGPKYWLLCKMLWDPDQAPEALADDLYLHLFGPVAPVMRAYFELLEEAWCTQSLPGTRSNYRWMNDPEQFRVFEPYVGRAWLLLGQAERQARRLTDTRARKADRADGARILNRVLYFKDSFAVSKSLIERYGAASRLQRIVDAPGSLPAPEALVALDQWIRAGRLRDMYDRAAALQRRDPPAFSLAPYPEFRAAFDRSSGVIRFVSDSVSRAVSAAVPDSVAVDQADLERRIEAVLAADSMSGARRPGVDEQRACGLLHSVSVERGALFVSRGAAPRINGRIDPAEWDAPAFSGRFYIPLSLEDSQTERTTVWTRTDATNLYLGFRCEGGAANITTTVTGTDQDPGAYPRMANDDCIALTFLVPGSGFAAVRINASGAVQGSRYVSRSTAVRTARGWEAELELPLAKLALGDPPSQARSRTVNIARYAHLPGTGKQPGPIEVGTLNPVPQLGNTIGSGNHAVCMVFVTGVPLVFQR